MHILSVLYPASLGSGVLDLQALFADSPLLPAEARHTIERFFAENCE